MFVEYFAVCQYTTRYRPCSQQTVLAGESCISLKSCFAPNINNWFLPTVIECQKLHNSKYLHLQQIFFYYLWKIGRGMDCNKKSSMITSLFIHPVFVRIIHTLSTNKNWCLTHLVMMINEKWASWCRKSIGRRWKVKAKYTCDSLENSSISSSTYSSTSLSLS